ncbi:type I glyceraldehyde-3-phosphate dehydrogenase [bacterium]
MMAKIGINGFGRIGRLVLRSALEAKAKDFDVVAINDLTDAKTLAHLFKYDSTFGIYKGTVEAKDSSLVIDGKEIKVIAERDPAKLPWKDLGVVIVVESTGIFTKRADAQKHIDAGAKKVIISAPAKEEDITIVMGVNEGDYDSANHNIVSNASCTTNCLAPIAKVLLENFGIKKGLMTTVHAYTNDQRILDFPHADLRRARAAAVSMIPTTTGAAKAVALVLPELKGKMDGLAVRVPTPDVSLVDLVVELEKNTTAEELNAAIKKACDAGLDKYVDYCNEPLVSIDFKGNKASSIFDSLTTKVLEGNLAKVMMWYDNEWGYSNRVVDLAQFMLAKM